MDTKRKNRKPALNQPMDGGIGSKPKTGPLDPKRASRKEPGKNASKKSSK